MTNIKVVKSDQQYEEAFDFIVDNEVIGEVVISYVGNNRIDDRVFKKIDELVESGAIDWPDGWDYEDIISELIE